MRAVLGLILLFGPLLAIELLIREQPRWLRPVLISYHVAMDMKLLLIEHRDGCPDLVSFGTSLSDHALPPRYLAKQSLAGATIDDPFDFAVAEVRGTNILAQYRWLRRQGCKPEWIVIEVSPVVINGELGGHTHDPALLDARALLGMPEGFAELRGYTIAEALELASYDRLLIHRRREQIGERLLESLAGERWFMSEEQRAKTPKKSAKRKRIELELDGKMTPHRKSLTAKAWPAEQRRRRRLAANGTYKWRVNQPEQQAILTVVREAASDGVGVILQAPPVTALYHREIAPKLGIAADFAEFVAEIQQLADELPNVVWIDAYADPGYEIADFNDWIHLSKRGAERYARQLIDTSNAALQAEQQP